MLSRIVVRASRAFATFSRAPRVAVVGSGPAGMYVCAGVLRRLPTCEIDVFDASPVPYGLIRYGVAPDHPEVKNCINSFEKLFDENANRLSLYCNVAIGRDVRYDELLAWYDAVVLAYGATKQRRLEVPGVDSRNVFTGGDFVSWYNAVPGAHSPLLDSDRAVIVGNGNVALDCCRVLLSPIERLEATDIPATVLDQLAHSSVSHVTIIGRRGPLDMSFTIKELREQVTLPGCSFAVEIGDPDAQRIAESATSLPRPRKRLVDLLVKSRDTRKAGALRHCQLLFRRTPEEVVSDESGRVCGIGVRNGLTGEREELRCGLLICSLGFENVLLDGVPQDEKGRMRMIDPVRVFSSGDTLVYASGWCAHPPRGVIVNTQVDSANVAAALCADVESRGTGRFLEERRLEERLRERGVRPRTWPQWKLVDQAERSLGAAHGKKREKVTSFEQNLKSPSSAAA